MDELDLAQLSANNRQSCRAPVPSWRKNRASSWMPICRRCAICKTASASGRRKRRWRVPNCWRRTVKTCRRTSPPSLRSTVNSPGAEPAGAAHGSGGVPAAAGDESNAAGAPGVKHPARAVAVAGLLQSAGRSPARPVARLPERPRPQQLDTEMAQLRVQRLRFEDLLSKQPQLRQIRQPTANR